jgi:hypothetical protein
MLCRLKINPPVLLLILLASLAARPVYAAACANPAGNEAAIFYNADYHTYQYCNGTSWKAFGGPGVSLNCFGSSTGTDTSLASGLVAYWNFNEDTGSTVYDDTGRGNLGTFNGTTGSQWTAGKIGYALSFNGTNNYVSLPTAGVAPSSGLTIAAWINPSTVSVNSSLYGFGPKSGCNPSGQYLSVNSSGKVTYLFGCGGTLTSSTTLTAGTWYHVALTVDSSKNATIYINGSAVAGPTNESSGQSVTTGNDLIGVEWAAGSLAQYFNGIIDEVGVWNVVLTGTQISTLYNSGAGNALGSLVCPLVLNYSGGFTN